MSQPNLLETLASRDFYESMDHYVADLALVDVVKQHLPPDWKLRRVNGVWFGCHPPIARRTPPQGWKIHISATVGDAINVLTAVVPILRDHQISFKFALDNRVLSLMNGKSWLRQGAGKFITIYPHEDQFAGLIEELHQATRAFSGPYILSDRRYRNSRVVFYRYGGMLPRSVLNVKGEQVPLLVGPSGETIPDIRRPYFFVPSWTRDPFDAEDPDSVREQVKQTGVPLNNGRYLVRSALAYSNSGGVYVADDLRRGLQVVIEEARPFVESSRHGTDLLQKEYRILSKIEHLNIAPRPVDFFTEWEHVFLAEEFIKGTSLEAFCARNNVLLLTNPTVADAQRWYVTFKAIFLQLAQIVRSLHELQIVFSDLSFSNLLISPDDQRLSIIDFEGAHEVGVDNPTSIYTPGFAFAHQMMGRPATFQSDYFSMGAIMFAFLWPVNQMFMIHPQARFTFLDSVTKDVGLPKSIHDMIANLMDKDPEKRPSPNSVITALQCADSSVSPETESSNSQTDVTLRKDVERILDYIMSVATYERRDRLYPAWGAVFNTNPLSIAYGACGVAYVINKVKKGVPDRVLEWILAANKKQSLYPPGLYLGLGGVAWTLLDLGAQEAAKNVLESTYDHPLLYESSDLFYGAAGWGLVNLKFFVESGDEKYLRNAERAGCVVAARAHTDSQGLFWPTEDGIPLGYAHGASGISLFFLYLYLASNKDQFLDIGRRALDFDIAHAYDTGGGGLSWKRAVEGANVVFPYWRYGSAGIGMVILRYYRLLKLPDYKRILGGIVLDTSRKYAVFPGFFIGLAGIGEFLLDYYQITGESEGLTGAGRVAAGLSLFRIDRPDGLAYPGERLRRICCDFGTGSAGVGHFLHRLASQSEGAFHLDELFHEGGVEADHAHRLRSRSEVTARSPTTVDITRN
jgi:hypothetical protein